MEEEFSLTVHKDLEAPAGLSWQMLVQVKPQLSARQHAALSRVFTGAVWGLKGCSGLCKV